LAVGTGGEGVDGGGAHRWAVTVIPRCDICRHPLDQRKLITGVAFFLDLRGL
jgi:hypothetical protein